MRFLIVSFVVSLLLLFGTSVVYGQMTSRDSWARASALYQSGEVQEALDLYLALERSGDISAALFYNIGNCYEKIDSPARAILYYERSLKLDPSDAQTLNNLEVVNQLRGEGIIPVDQFFLVAWIRSAAVLLSPMGWGLLCVTGIWLLALFIAAKLTGKAWHWSWMSLPAILVCAGLALGAASYLSRNKSDEAIVMHDAAARVAPDQLSQQSRVVGAGEKVRILDSLDVFYKVRFVNFEVGWLKKGAIERI